MRSRGGARREMPRQFPTYGPRLRPRRDATFAAPPVSPSAERLVLYQNQPPPWLTTAPPCDSGTVCATISSVCWSICFSTAVAPGSSSCPSTEVMPALIPSASIFQRRSPHRFVAFESRRRIADAPRERVNAGRRFSSKKLRLVRFDIAEGICYPITQ